MANHLLKYDCDDATMWCTEVVQPDTKSFTCQACGKRISFDFKGLKVQSKGDHHSFLSMAEVGAAE